ncbi:patatin-like phospholipase family protein [uncultured Litoreibacter sp.]|uniref:patatin-like phospholipase family protein n=1 Tax=uncultured Litoreibacter sp. TaxID=1392394 RepID=UPI00262BCE95|nr:patatin-like phospholipase family protein [uncultured Litoreibacter sp.]
MCSAITGANAATVAQSEFDPTTTTRLPIMAMSADEVAPSMADALRQSVGAALRPAAATRTSRKPIVIDVLSLSAGGQYGSFGAGFLRGWSQNPKTPRPKFDLVTGVSAGGMLAPVAFSGNRHDAALDVFRGLSKKGVFKGRPVFALGNSSSFFDPAPLEKTLKTLLTDGMIADVAKQHESGARLLVMAVDLDTTRATVFDLGEMAASDLPLTQRRNCMAEVMLASAAIPGVFPPRNIDGTLYVDGGLRDQIFLREVETARTLLVRDTGRAVKIRATIVVNGSLKVPEGKVKDSLIGYAERSLYTLSDEVLRDSIIETLSFAEKNSNWEVQGVIAELPVEDICPLGETVGTFDACVTTALFDSGVKLGKTAPVDFMTSAELYALANAY